MITDRAKDAIDRIFHDAVRMHMPLDGSDSLVLASGGKEGAAGGEGDELMVVTTSSFFFRMLTMFRVADSAESLSYFARGRTDVPLSEAFSEVANLCCGAMNRELARHFPHLGMSTPYVLGSRCLDFLADLRPQHLVRLDVAINGGVRVQATLCVCGSAPIDFVATVPSSVDATSSGELEFL